jgi:hypothetical protein
VRESQQIREWGGIQMDLLITVAVIVAVIAVLVAGVTWSRRGQSSIGREPGGTVYETRFKEQGKGTRTGPTVSTSSRVPTVDLGELWSSGYGTSAR